MLLMFLATGCSVKKVDLLTIYGKYRKTDKTGEYQCAKKRNPVIIIPGIKGTRLKNIDNSDIVWGKWWQYVSFKIDDLELDFYNKSLNDIKKETDYKLFDVESNITPDGIFLRWRVFNIFHVDVYLFDIYEDLIDTLEKYGGFKKADYTLMYDKKGWLTEIVKNADQHDPNLFIFSYDWRRDNVLNAVNLSKFISEVKDKYFVNRKDGWDKNVKFNIIAHSMGGLIARFYVGYYDHCKEAQKDDATAIVYRSIENINPGGADQSSINKVILLGTPNKGSIESLSSLTEGKNVETLSPDVCKMIIPTMPSGYQLLPQKTFGECFKPIQGQNGKGNKELYDSINKRSLYDFEVWKKLKLSAYGEEWKSRNEIKDDEEIRKLKAQCYIKRCLDRACEFSDALKRFDETCTKRNDEGKEPAIPFIMMGGDCALTLKCGIIDDNNRLIVEEETIDKHVKEKVISSYEYYEPGDGVVTRESMVGAAHIRSVFVCQDHSSLFKNETLKDNLLYELLVTR